MLGATAVVSLASFFLLSGAAVARQIPLQPDDADLQPASFLDGNHAVHSQARPRKLHGRFLQITDFHPDPFYETYASTSQDAACHRGTGPAGYYGAETSECDSPFSLINATFDWIKAELKDQIDFVVWTGDSARHDNDEDHPRTIDQVVSLNQYLVDKVAETFGKSDYDDGDPTNDLTIPVVPTFGNNDILPHNIFDKGPNRWTKTFLSVWKMFIPEEQRHQFDQGGWFSVEVIPGYLTVFSLNSLYFFDSNSAVDGCAAKSEPGYRQFEWLRIQLQYLRVRGMKAIIIGHVAPARTTNKQAWDESCWQKYALWMRQYRDIIVGSMYGHMNLDHFMLQDFDDITKNVDQGYERINSLKRSLQITEEPLKTQASGNYLVDLRDGWSKLPTPPSKKDSKKSSLLQALMYGDDETLTENEVESLLDHDSDALRANEKDKKNKGDKKKKKPADYLEVIGGPFAERFSVSLVSPSVVPNYFPTIRVYEYNITGIHPRGSGSRGWAAEEKELLTDAEESDDIDIEKKKKKKKKQKFTVPDPPSKNAPPGPAYSPQSLSLTRFTQYYANLTRLNNDFNTMSEAQLDGQGWKEGKHKGRKPHDRDHEPHPKPFKYEVLYDTQVDEVYNMTDLTVKSFLGLAQRIGKSGATKSKGSSDVDVKEEEEDEKHNEEQKATTGKGKKEKQKKKDNEAWLAFVSRAFVGTMDEDEIEDTFGN